ncbi:MAG: phosphomannomutase/phosphoglucomutase, partial [Propionibacteriaceae bacterium]|nr:phosphomannomutase/phosphoglucomutase [Propionibacteriaceae bacterium]
TQIKPIKVVVDAGNGMAGLTAHSVLGSLVEVIGLYLELDGLFPNHQPNPLIPENLVDAQRAVIGQQADLGLVFDGDADRCFFIDERGEVVDPSAITALIAAEVLRHDPGAAIVVNSITSRATQEHIRQLGGRVVVSPVGHSFIKTHMANEQAVFGGEHSGHFYFRNFWGADTGMLAALNVIALLGRGAASMSALVADLPRYAASGEINTAVANPRELMSQVEQSFAAQGEVDHRDGLLIHTPDWWVSVRMSNTEPLLRLNVEAKTAEKMTALRDQALAVIRKEN